MIYRGGKWHSTWSKHQDLMQGTFSYFLWSFCLFCFVSSFSSPSFDSSLTACVLLQGTSTLTWRFTINLIVSPQRDLSIHALFRVTHTGLCTRVTIGILLICVELKRKALNTCHDYNSWEKVGGRENMALFVLSAIAQCPA